MDVKSYCDTISNQLIGWKASIYDIIRAAQRLSDKDRKTVQPMIDSLNRVMDDLNRNLNELKSQCPADWSPQRQDIEGKMGRLKSNFEQISDELQSLLPDSTAWV